MAINIVSFIEQHRFKIIEFFSSLNNDGKNPVSLIMELGNKLGVGVLFKDTEQGGLSNNPVFIFEVRIGSLRCQGIKAYSKKEAKKNAAEKVIQILKSRTGINDLGETVSSSTSRSLAVCTPKAKRSMEELKTVRTPDVRHSPMNSDPADSSPVGAIIGKLQELAVNKHWLPPEYELVNETGQSHDKRFIIECKLNDFISQGLGKNKKAAKQLAAENMMSMLQESDRVLKSQSSPKVMDSISPEDSSGAKKMPFTKRTLSIDTTIDRSLQTKKKKPDFLGSYLYSEIMDDSSDDDEQFINMDPMRFSGMSNVAASVPDDETLCNSLEARAREVGLKVEYIDLKARSFCQKFQCFVKLSTEPVAVLCGSGDTPGAAHAQAAHNALEYLDVIS